MDRSRNGLQPIILIMGNTQDILSAMDGLIVALLRLGLYQPIMMSIIFRVGAYVMKTIIKALN